VFTVPLQLLRLRPLYNRRPSNPFETGINF